MDNRTNEAHKLTDSAISLSRYVEPATILTLVVGAVYYIGWAYVDGFCQRTGLHHESFDFATTYYIRNGFVAIFVSSLVVSLTLLSGRGQPKSRPDALLKNAPALAAVGVLALIASLGSTTKSRAGFNLIAITIGAVIPAVAFFSWWRMPLILWPKNLAVRPFVAVLLYYHLVFAANALGDFRGKKTIEGETYDSSVITFQWKDQPIKDVEGKELILIMYRGGNYYVAQRESPAPQFPNVFVIPDDRVSYVSIKTRK